MNDTFMTIDASEFAKAVREENSIVLDVRTPQEYRVEHIPGAFLLPHNEIPYQQEILEEFRGKQICIYCHAGVRSVAAAYYLSGLGFEQCLNLRGGIDEWIEAGGEITHG